MKKTFIFAIFTLIIIGLSACQNKSTETIDETLPDDVIETPTISEVSGLDDVSHIKNVYFNPLDGVIAKNQNGEDISHYIEVSGHIHYGLVGSYTLNYTLSYGDDFIEESRTIDIIDGPIERQTFSRNQQTGTQVNIDGGSYRIGSLPSISHPPQPMRISEHLLEKTVPSNGWWTSLLVSNHGGGNGIYTNPLRSSFSPDGVEITNPGKGFVQYWNPEGLNTMANFSLALPDMHLRSQDLSSGFETHVIDYSDTHVKVALRGNNQKEDRMVLTYQQGSPYVFAEVSNHQSSFIHLASNGTTGYSFYTLGGLPMNDATYQGNALIVKINNKHVGYQTSRPAQVGQPTYDDQYFLISLPEGSTFNLSNVGSPFGGFNRIGFNLNLQNYFSIAAIRSLSEASFYHEHAYTKTLKGDVSYHVSNLTGKVTTTYRLSTQTFEGEHHDAIQFLMPHQYQVSDAEVTNYTFQTVRGILKAYVGNMFQTELYFHGLLPAMTLPNNQAFSQTDMTSYLQDLDQRNQLSDEDNFLNDEGPYWSGKAIYPLAQGIIIADQMSNEALKSSLISKLRYVLQDWFSYTSTQDKRYLYYNERWGSVYYSNNDFNTASELSDHSFTHGYLIYGASVLSMYDQNFYESYQGVIQVLLNDYLYPHKDAYDFAYLRSFDPWAGHMWAHGFGTFAEGNNLESTSEALQSWLAGYLWALQTDNTELRDAAIYGFVTELYTAKTYFFDYDDIIFPPNYNEYAQVAGIVWGGKYDYATWFGANPTFIYGIHWLPNGEYISNYATNAFEQNRLSQIFTKYLSAKGGVIDTWYAQMWSIQALINPDLAISNFNANLILTDDYPNDLSQTYYLIHGLKTYGQRDTTYQMVLHQRVTSSIYKNEQGVIHALIWNPSQSRQTVTFIGPNDVRVTHQIAASSFESVRLN